MTSTRNILIAFLLNFSFSVLEFIGGALTGSVAITSDAIHDLGDAASIGFSYLLEKRSKKAPDAKHSFGYARYSLIGSALTTGVLAFGSVFIIREAILRIIEPTPVDYQAMIVLAIFGFVVNLVATFVTRRGDSHNQKAVNLHMLEDVLGWLVVLVGAIIMHFTDLAIIDSIMSLGIAIFILISAVRQFKTVLDIMLDSTPSGLDIAKLEKALVKNVDGLASIHHTHLWSNDGIENYATLHAVLAQKAKSAQVKQAIKRFLAQHDIDHATVEIELPGEECDEVAHVRKTRKKSNTHHHHH